MVPCSNMEKERTEQKQGKKKARIELEPHLWSVPSFAERHFLQFSCLFCWFAIFAIFLLFLMVGLSLSLKPTQLGPTVFASPPNWIPRPHGQWIEFWVFVFCFRTLGSYFRLVCWVRTANSFFVKLCILQQFSCLQNSGSSLFSGI